jgi:hypothetical protein
MIPAMRSWIRDEMIKRVAFFKDLKGSKTGLPDSDPQECKRELINVIGFQPPDNEGAVVSPVGAAGATERPVGSSKHAGGSAHGGRTRRHPIGTAAPRR